MKRVPQSIRPVTLRSVASLVELASEAAEAAENLLAAYAAENVRDQFGDGTPRLFRAVFHRDVAIAALHLVTADLCILRKARA